MQFTDEAAMWQRLLGVPAGADSLTVCRAFERLAVALAPRDLAGVPFYAMPTSALPADFTAASRHCGGWYQDWGHLYIRPYHHAYRGAGLSAVINDVPDPERAEWLARGAQAYYAARGEHVPLAELLEFVPPADSVERVCGTLTHELAHGLDSLASGEFAEWGRDLFTANFAPRLLAREVKRGEQQTEPPPPQVHCHGLRFTRIVAHLDHRLRHVGVRSSHLAAAGEQFGQRPYAECYAALGDEPARCVGKSFAQILALPMPAAFVACHLESAKP